MGSINLVTEVPGPKSLALLERRHAATPAGLAHATRVAVESAHGALVKDVDGNTLIDMAGGIGMLNVGHTNEQVVAAVQDQVAKLTHVCALVASYEPYVALAEKLNEITPGDFAKKTILTNSGSEAVENAVKLARVATGRSAVVVFEGAYHGRTLLTMSMTSKYALFKKGFGPFAPEIYRLPVPNVYRRPEGMDEGQYLCWCLEQLDHAFVAQIDPTAVAAIVIEPVQGEAGFLPMPTPFLQRIREICDEHGIVMVADEIQSGFGRTGKLFAIEHTPIVPDVITMAKSLGAGLPIAAVTGKAEVMDAAHFGGVGGTYGGSPVSCAAALAAVEQINTPAFLQRSVELGQRMHNRLLDWKEKFEIIGDARGLGAMQLVELVLDRKTKAPAPNETLAIIQQATARGLLLIRAGLYSNCIRFLPPLVITDTQVDEAFDVLESAIAEVSVAA